MTYSIKPRVLGSPYRLSDVEMATMPLDELRDKLRRNGYHFGKPSSICRTWRKNIQNSRGPSNVVVKTEANSDTAQPVADTVRNDTNDSKSNVTLNCDLATWLKKGYKVFRIYRDDNDKHFILLDIPIGAGLSLYHILYPGESNQSVS